MGSDPWNPLTPHWQGLLVSHHEYQITDCSQAHLPAEADDRCRTWPPSAGQTAAGRWVSGNLQAAAVKLKEDGRAVTF